MVDRLGGGSWGLRVPTQLWFSAPRVPTEPCLQQQQLPGLIPPGRWGTEGNQLPLPQPAAKQCRPRGWHTHRAGQDMRLADNSPQAASNRQTSAHTRFFTESTDTRTRSSECGRGMASTICLVQREHTRARAHTRTHRGTHACACTRMHTCTRMRAPGSECSSKLHPLHAACPPRVGRHTQTQPCTRMHRHKHLCKHTDTQRCRWTCPCAIHPYANAGPGSCASPVLPLHPALPMQSLSLQCRIMQISSPLPQLFKAT